jgi:cobalt-zinc-cadmium resistance protein CzcA
MMLKGDNSSRVIKDVKEKITQIQKTLPEGVELEPFLDRTKMVNSAIGTVTKNLLEGALIVILILVLFLGNLRAGIIVSSVIPLSMLFAVIMMNMFGVSGNLMSLGALDFGLIVDGAVIIVEACMFQLHVSRQQKVSQLQMDDIVYSTSTSRVW